VPLLAVAEENCSSRSLKLEGHEGMKRKNRRRAFDRLLSVISLAKTKKPKCCERNNITPASLVPCGLPFHGTEFVAYGYVYRSIIRVHASGITTSYDSVPLLATALSV
jgi:hypothetical protein